MRISDWSSDVCSSDLMKSDRADMFRLNLEPGQTVTFAAEMASRQVPGLMLWDPEVYQAKQQERMLFNGVLLGITGLQIGRASWRKECVSTCRSRWSP